jgi:hypothetical protein
VSKKKTTKKSRATSASSRRAAATRSASRGVKRKARQTVRKIQLKPIRVAIARAIEFLKKLPPSNTYNLTIERLQRCEMELNDICDPNNPDGCGPNMEFPREALATSR